MRGRMDEGMRGGRYRRTFRLTMCGPPPPALAPTGCVRGYAIVGHVYIYMYPSSVL